MRWIIFFVIYIILDIYAFQAFKTVTRNPWFYYVYLALSLAVLLNLFYQWNTSDVRGISGAKAYAIGFFLVFFIPKLVTFVFLFGEDIVRVIIGFVRKLAHSGSDLSIPDRRKFLSQIALGVAAIPFASLLYGMYQGRYKFRIIRHTLFFEDLPKAFDGYRITQISDIHSGSLGDRQEIMDAVNLINAQESDVVFFTGDLVNNIASEMEPWKEVFRRIKAKDGVFSVLGNHDYGDYVNWDSAEAKRANLQAVKNVHGQMGWNLLLNENRWIEKDGQKIAVVGVENWGTGGFTKQGDLEKASKGVDAEDFKILLSHDPSHWQAKVKSDPKNYQLTLSGHTHGMQFGIEIPGWVKWSPIQYRYENWAGIYKEFGRYINVNRGFGTLAYPGRVGIWPEITVIELRKGTAPE